ncbi:DUF4893 domain-containing protein [Aminobacter anthyllidis]|uniref:DUF4893 domain-containing protein n=1 Tax=Aminobacter anthyllidis TaxID=1035067 RepID=A0A9X1AA11_9HYPH|nr:DUF4893 domain-containing protein [Aminobacter anthyllidis]MBT1156040.1 DUF4893 domain-containing protein [Aminobacter anthyllidis]
MAVRKLILAAALAATATFAHADGVVQKLITPADKARLEKYDATRKEALQEAKAGLAGEVATLDAIVAQKPLSFSDFDMTGNWQCRTIKAGGLGALVVYGWFKCKVTDDGSGWMLEKISGSQRTKGRFYTESDNRLIYLGSGFVAGDKPKAYGRGPDADQVGYAFRSGPAAWRIEFPAPRYESKLDIIEFRR